jgi:HPt (histidine-containing phosphotransfer) domain-containing protein
MYSRLLTSFSRKYADASKQLRALLDRGDGYEAQRLLHSLRGSAVHLGAVDVYRSASRLEEAVRASEGVSAEDMKELEQRLSTVFLSIRKYKQSVSKTNDSDNKPDMGGDGR